MDAAKLKFMFTQPDGRIGRQTWWLGVLILIIAEIVLTALFGQRGLLPLLFGLAMLIAGVMLHVKRCHDRGKSGLWTILIFVPVIGWIWAIIDLGILEGDPGDNRYGPAPSS